MPKNINVYYKISSLHGTILHFYHFFYGVLVPLIIEYEKLSVTYDEVLIIIDDHLGPMLRLLLELPIHIRQKHFVHDIDEKDIETRYLPMMDVQPSYNERDKQLIKKKWAKRFEYKHYQLINLFMKKQINEKHIFTCNKTYEIIIIKRFTHVSFKSLTDSNIDIIKLNGSHRRSIPNHDDVVDAVKNIFPNKSLMNISTEYMSLFQQYHLINNCDILIAQHGAALAQIAFMKPGSIVIELVEQAKIDEGEDWFRQVSTACRIKHYQYITHDPHEVIDLDKFTKFVNKSI